jgi:DNA repair protein RadC
MKTKYYIKDASGSYKSLSDEEVISHACKIIEQKFVREHDVISEPGLAKEYIKLRIGSLEHEVFCCFFLDTRHRVICCEEMFRGTLDGTSVHPREVVKRTLHHNAAAVIFAHNHPSGVAEPSDADRRLTRRLKESLALIDVRVLDHFVVGSEETVSFAERGLI